MITLLNVGSWSEDCSLARAIARVVQEAGYTAIGKLSHDNRDKGIIANARRDSCELAYYSSLMVPE